LEGGAVLRRLAPRSSLATNWVLLVGGAVTVVEVYHDRNTGQRVLNDHRATAAQPRTSAYLAPHAGNVLYRRIGSDERLNFTVIGSAVNGGNRIASTYRSVDRRVVMSESFASATADAERTRSMSVRSLRPGRCQVDAGAAYDRSGAL